ncbi:MAG: hypothetical protein NTW86_06240 [Candidatus Sumerlaeota bacterium]|nr:hypothetical protein [Candidatus Sumerlaeota bacterium]
MVVNVEDQPDQFSLPVSIEKTGDLRLLPQRLFFGFVRNGMQCASEIRIQSRGKADAPLRVSRAPRKLKMECIVNHPSSNEWVLACQLAAARQPTDLSGPIEDDIYISDGAKEYRIPIYAILDQSPF